MGRVILSIGIRIGVGSQKSGREGGGAAGSYVHKNACPSEGMV